MDWILVWVFTGFIQPSIALYKRGKGIHPWVCVPTDHVYSNTFLFKTYLSCSFIQLFFSSPEHEVLMVSYCGQWLSVVRRRVSCEVCRPSTFDVYTL